MSKNLKPEKRVIPFAPFSSIAWYTCRGLVDQHGHGHFTFEGASSFFHFHPPIMRPLQKRLRKTPAYGLRRKNVNMWRIWPAWGAWVLGGTITHLLCTKSVKGEQLFHMKPAFQLLMVRPEREKKKRKFNKELNSSVTKPPLLKSFILANAC